MPRGGNSQARSVRPGGRRPTASPPPARTSAGGGYRGLLASYSGLPHVRGPRLSPATPLPADQDLGRRALLASFQPLRGTTGSRPQGRNGVASRRASLPCRASRASPRATTTGGADRARIVAGAVDDPGWSALAFVAGDPTQAGTTVPRRVRDSRHPSVLQPTGTTRRLRDRAQSPAKHPVGGPSRRLLLRWGSRLSAGASVRDRVFSADTGSPAPAGRRVGHRSPDRENFRASVASGPGLPTGRRRQRAG